MRWLLQDPVQPVPNALPAVEPPAAAAPGGYGGVGAPLPGALETRPGGYGGAGGYGGYGYGGPFPTLLDAATAAPPNISILLQAVTAANLTAPLSDPNTTWTIFAPDNAAFEALLTKLNIDNATLFAPEQNATLINILSYHVVPNASLGAADLVDGPLPTLLNGEPLNVTL
jgi:hypothetical protein